MKELLEQHCLDENAKGLLLLSMPTGFGKTHTVLDFIYEHYRDFAAQKRKIFFVTNLKKNLAYKELKERFKADNAEEDYNKHVLFIDSNAESVVNHLLSVGSDIPDQFKTGSYNLLKSYIEMLANDGRLPKTFTKELKDQIFKKLEPEFRKSIVTDLHQKFKTKEDRLNAIKNNREYQWIGTLYPAVFTDEKTVLFLSMDKFVQKNVPLVEGSYYFQKRLIDRGLIFIDEFDATKERVLNHIIESGISYRIDLLDLFLTIHNHLVVNEFPESLLRESEQRKKMSSGKDWPSPRDIIENFRERSDNLFRKYSLHHICKSRGDLSSTKRNFLFYDYQFHHVLNARQKRIVVVPDAQNSTNWIETVDAESKGCGVNIRSLLRDITGFLAYFQKGVGYLAENYCQVKKEDPAIQEVFPLDLAVRTVLNNFRLDPGNVRFLTDVIMEHNVPYGRRAKVSDIHKKGFYDTGFSYYDIVDSDEHDTLSKIYMYSFSRTPESFLVEICSRAMVVGMSATAGLYTNIGNYDLKFLRSRLGNLFVRPSGISLQRIKEQFSERTCGYDQVSINTDFIGTDDPEENLEILQSLLDDREAAVALQRMVESNNLEADEKQKDFIFSRYVRALTAWEYFLKNSEAHAFLCFFNTLPRTKNPRFDLTILHDYAEMIQSRYISEMDEPVSDTITVLEGEGFEASKARLLDDLKSGKRRFVLSTYQTIGAGQNLQYPIPELFSPVKINGFPDNEEMDFDAVYLDKPTHLLVNIFSGDLKDEDFVKYIFQLEFLVENGAISPKTFETKLDEAFHRHVGKYRKKRGVEDFINIYQTEAYSRDLNQKVIQALGRICRTNMKAPVIHVLADTSIRRYLSHFSLPEDVIPVREYTALLELTGGACAVPEGYSDLQNRASNRSNRSAAIIYGLLNNPWNLERVQFWQELREQTLKHPSIASKEGCDPRWSPLYVELPSPGRSYKYTQANDYRDIEVFFSTENEAQEVSERSARLQELIAIDPLRKLFVEKGWATCFSDSELMLTPPIFNNIYKGALGEACGRYILEDVLGIPLKELDISEFELFDFKTENKIYVDFKLWNDQIAVPADEVVPKIREKMERCDANRVFIINILGSSGDEFRPTVSFDGKIIEIPFVCQDRSLSADALKFILEEFVK